MSNVKLALAAAKATGVNGGYYHTCYKSLMSNVKPNTADYSGIEASNDVINL